MKTKKNATRKKKQNKKKQKNKTKKETKKTIKKTNNTKQNPPEIIIFIFAQILEKNILFARRDIVVRMCLSLKRDGRSEKTVCLGGVSFYRYCVKQTQRLHNVSVSRLYNRNRL